MQTPRFIKKIQQLLDSIHIPFLGISLWKMFEIYVEGLFKNPVLRQAAAISWSFFFSLFPFILFLLSALPFLPHYDTLQQYIFEVLLPRILPGGIYSIVSDYLLGTFIPNLKQISNVYTILFALIFGTNGTQALISGFNLNTDKKRPFLKEYLIALGITLAFAIIIVASLFGIYYGEVVTKLFNQETETTWLTGNLTQIISFVSFPIFFFLLLTLFYWAGCLKISKFREAIPGAIFTTLLFGVLIYLFAFYVQRIARYNVLYGSIGSIILVMIWVNLSIILMLFGNQLNLAIKQVRDEKKLKALQQENS